MVAQVVEGMVGMASLEGHRLLPLLLTRELLAAEAPSAEEEAGAQPGSQRENFQRKVDAFCSDTLKVRPGVVLSRAFSIWLCTPPLLWGAFIVPPRRENP